MKSILLLLLSLITFKSWSAPVDYQVRFDLASQELYVQACFHAAPPSLLKTATRSAKEYINSVRWEHSADGSSTIPEARTYSIRLYYREAGCFNYTVSYDGRERRTNSKSLRQHTHNQITLTIQDS